MVRPELTHLLQTAVADLGPRGQLQVSAGCAWAVDIVEQLFLARFHVDQIVCDAEVTASLIDQAVSDTLTEGASVTDDLLHHCANLSRLLTLLRDWRSLV
jgi:hypothetical protein